MFQEMIERMKRETLGILFRIQLASESSSLEDLQKKQDKDLVFSGGGDGAPPPKKKPVRRDNQKVGRNDPCPCGSGKKYKKCHGR